MSVDLINIRASGLRNEPGFCYFWFIDVNLVDIDSISIDQNAITEVLPLTQSDWKQGAWVFDSIKYSASPHKEIEGFKVQLSGDLARSSDINSKAMSLNATTRYIVIFKDRNGVYRQLGTKKHGLLFGASEEIKGDTGNNQYSYSFAGFVRNRPSTYLEGIARDEHTDRPPTPT